jgi:uncharacterized membrane protein (DUF106 family)
MKGVDYLVIFLASLFVISLSLAAELLLIFLNKLDIDKIKELKEEIKKKQEKIKELMREMRESKDEKKLMEIQGKIAKLQNELLANNFKIMKERFKVSLLTWIPALFIFIRLNKYMGGFSFGWFLIYLVSFMLLDKIIRKIVKLDY